MDFALGDEESLVVQTVRRFAERELRAWSADADRAGAPPPRLGPAGAELGFFTDAVPTSAGGTLDGAYPHLVRALRGYELGRGCAGLAAVLESNVEPALAVGRWGGPEARAALFASLAAGGLATTGRDSRGALVVEADGAGVRVSGRIGPLPVLGAARHVLLLARVAEEPVLVLIDLAGVGVSRDAITPSAWRAARWGIAVCEQAPVAAPFVIARGSVAVDAGREVLTWYRASLAARAAGVAAAAMEHAARYGKERVQFGQPIGTFESLIRLRDDAETGAAAARWMALHAAWLIDRSEGRGDAQAADAASRARVLAGDVVTRATIDAVQIFGGYGFVNDYPVEKLMRDARAFEALLGDERLDRILAAKAG